MLAQLTHFFSPNPVIKQAHGLYISLVEQSRQPAFYATHNVPDTIDGRFDMIVLHTFLIIERLRGVEASEPIAQALIDTLMEDMDSSIREFGVGDSGVAKRLKKMAYAFNGRMTAYGDAIDDKDTLYDVIARNIYREESAPNAAQALTNYTIESKRTLSDLADSQILKADLSWAQL